MAVFCFSATTEREKRGGRNSLPTLNNMRKATFHQFSTIWEKRLDFPPTSNNMRKWPFQQYEKVTFHLTPNNMRNVCFQPTPNNTRNIRCQSRAPPMDILSKGLVRRPRPNRSNSATSSKLTRWVLWETDFPPIRNSTRPPNNMRKATFHQFPRCKK